MSQWQERRLIRHDEIPEELLFKAEKLSEKEKFLFDSIAPGDLDEVIVNALAEDIVASYSIEHEMINPWSVKDWIIGIMGLKAKDWADTDWIEPDPNDNLDDIPFDPKEQRAAQAIMTCLNDRPLTHEIIFRTNGLFNGKTESVYRDREEIVRSRTRVVYHAPAPKFIPGLMDNFISWWHSERTLMPSFIGSVIAHYGFVAIHPFLDGNGRTARALAEKALITSPGPIFRPYSLSAAIEHTKSDYYEALRTGDPFIFAKYILHAYVDAIDYGAREVKRIKFLKNFFKRDAFSLEEKSIIRKMSTEPKSRWLPKDFYLIVNGKQIFLDLQARGIVDSDGRFNMGWRPDSEKQASVTQKP